MARLPIPGSDENTWGTILNDFLSVDHNSDGTLKASGTISSKADASTTITAGTGLTGGGDLSANRTLSANFGTTAGTIAQGNDSRITGAVQSTLIDAKGDLLVGSAADTVIRQAVGTTGQTLMADSTQTSGVKWYVNSNDTSAASYGYHSATRNIGTFRSEFGQNNEIWIARILVRAGYAINKIGTFIKTAGTLGAGGTNGFAIASDDGSTLLFSHDDDSLWTTAGERSVLLGGSAIAAQPVDTFYRVQLSVNGYSAAPVMLLAQDHAVLSDFQGMSRFNDASVGFQGGGGYNPVTFGNSAGGFYPLILLG